MIIRRWLLEAESVPVMVMVPEAEPIRPSPVLLKERFPE